MSVERYKSSKIKAFHLATPLLVAALAGFAGACGDPDEFVTKALIPPSPSAEAAAIDFHASFPQSRILFSQNSGEILLIDNRGQSLMSGDSDTPEDALNTVISFMHAHPDLYGIHDPERDIQLAEAFRDRDKVFETHPTTGITSLRFWYVPGQYPDPGRYGIAFFKADGALTALITEFHPEPVQAASSGGTGTTQQPLTLRLPDVQSGWRRIHDRQLGRTVDVRIERHQFRTIKILRDPRTGEEIQRIDETGGALVSAPSDWKSTGTLISTDAPDTLRAPRTILSTSAGGLVLGFSIPGVHAAGEAVSIGDAAFGEAVPLQPIATDRSSWLDEPGLNAEVSGYPGITLRDSTRLAENLETVLNWYDAELDWKSWDGIGGSFYAGVRGHRRPQVEDKPSPRAYGGNGYLLVNGGHTGAGVPISHALDIVAHEFSHSVVTATADFAGAGEPGALNESLADVLGTIIKGYSNGTVLGLEAGISIRDVAVPGNLGDPDTYGDYRIVEEDGGGIHSNCGVMNRALSLAILGQQGQPAVGEVPMAKLLLESMRFSSFSPLNTLEGFAAVLSVSCRLSGRTFCDRLETSFDSTELLNFDTAIQ